MSQGRRLRGAILGFGHVAAEGHAPIWGERSDAEIVAVADASPERRARFLKMRPDGRAYADAATLLAEEDLDFVDVCTPPSSHAALVEQALERGLHVLCEKPLTTAAEDAERIAAAAARARRTVHTVHNWLAAPVCRKISALVDEGRIGKVRQVSWATLRTRPAVAVGEAGALNWRLDPEIAGGGILLDHGWHAAYCVARWAGGAPTSLSARLETRRFHDLAVEDTATVALAFEGGISGKIHLTWAAEQRDNTVSIAGDAGTIEVAGPEVILRDAHGLTRWACPPALSEGSHHPDWFAAVVEGFAAAIAGSGSGNLAEAVTCARVMDRAKASSAADGAWLPVVARPIVEQSSHPRRMVR